MRNLTILDVQAANLPMAPSPQHTLGPAICVDVVSKTVYALVNDTSGLAGLCSVQLVDTAESTAAASSEARHVCSFPFSLGPNGGALASNMQFLMERESVFLALRSGDIFTVRVGSAGGSGEAELVGTVDSGIMACGWSPDEELLALVTGEARLLLMTQDFDVVDEFPLSQGQQGEEAPVALGWGKRETQYHGKAGKAAAAALQTADPAQRSETARSRMGDGDGDGDGNGEDDGVTRISWRGDGAFFAVSFVAQGGARELRVFSREGRLHSIGEQIEGLKHTLSWRPSGRLIAATERLDHRHDVVFFERNGLRHGEFALRKATRRVMELAWNADSSVLAVTALVDTGADAPEVCVELWADRNYHWYLKQELRASSVPGGSVLRAAWDAEDPMRLHVTGSRAYVSVRLHAAPDVAHVASEKSNAAAVVADGARLLYTPFRWANVPPPMALHTLDVPMPAAHVAFASFGHGNDFAVLLADRRTVVLYECGAAALQGNRPAERGRVSLGGGIVAHQIAWPSRSTLVCLGLSAGHEAGGWQQAVAAVDLTESSESGESSESSTAARLLDGGSARAIRLVAVERPSSSPLLLLAAADGLVLEASVDGAGAIDVAPLARLPAGCVEVDAAVVEPEGVVVVGRTERNQLFAGGNLLSSVCSSFYLRRDFLVLTTTTHFVRFVPVDGGLLAATVSEEDGESPGHDEARRRVERGSAIVLAAPLGDSVVFQMPRGNLETVRPRALVLAAVRRALDARRYREALAACRANRIDMNVIFDHAPAALMADWPEFVAQVDDPDLLNLFISGLRDEDVTASMYAGPRPRAGARAPVHVAQKTTRICRALRPVLLQAAGGLGGGSGGSRLMPSVLTTFMCETPADVPAALRMLAPLSTDERDAALTYLLFLSDVDTVYRAALGLYDLPLALLVAQRSQRDPREYLAELGGLNALSSEEYRRFKIDAQLGRPELAVGHLCAAYLECAAGSSAAVPEGELWAELAEYVDAQDMHRCAIRLLGGHRRFGDACVLLGERQAARGEWGQAAASFLLGGASARAVDAFVRAREWRTALAVASEGGAASAQTVYDTAVRASAVLAEHHLFLDAAAVLMEYTQRDEEAVALLVRGAHWAEAVRCSLLRQRPDLVETTVRPGLLEAHSAAMEDVREIHEAYAAKLERLREVRATPLEVLAHNGQAEMEGEVLDNVDVMSDTTSMASRFSTFSATITNASSRMTGSTARRLSKKGRRKEERRKGRGKKGSVYEEAYLVDSLAKLVDRVRVHQMAVRDMNWALIRDARLLSMAAELQAAFMEVVVVVVESATFVFDEQRMQMRLDANGNAEPVPMEVNEHGMASQPKLPKPVLPGFAWKIEAICE
ncbi:putative elongator complex protein 1 [Coemansia sp. BCRC 34962]|nr:putative elongator complex protein 1 [Coemansia sp. BCRC 34962]